MPRKPSPHLLAAQADRLSLDDLKQLVAYLSEQIQERESCASPDQPTPETGWRSEYRKCGKSNCRCAGGIHLHGPYWYRSVREGDRTFKQYWRKGKAIDRPSSR
jgi:hypothetical protein